jgi:hypothetical protein
MGSFDTAYDGSKISTDNVYRVLSQGFRMIDMAVFYDVESGSSDTAETAVVGYSASGTYPATGKNNVALRTILNTVITNAFSQPSPNPRDPLFLQIRPMYKIIQASDDPTTQFEKKGVNYLPLNQYLLLWFLLS